jgi:DNA-binding NarL/FixJ family response regulator
MLCMELSDRIRLVLLDDHVLFRESLARLLASEPDLELVAECSTPSEALKSLDGSGVDVVLVDIGIAKEFIPSARKNRYQGKCLAIARETDATGSAVVLRSGASGIFLDSDSSARLIQAIRLVANGEAWVDQKVIQLLAERYPDYEDRWFGALAEREQTVLQGVIDGLSNRKIGGKIGMSESTIKAILQRLFTKAGVRTRSQLVRIALEAASAGSASQPRTQ